MLKSTLELQLHLCEDYNKVVVCGWRWAWTINTSSVVGKWPFESGVVVNDDGIILHPYTNMVVDVHFPSMLDIFKHKIILSNGGD